MRFSNTFLCTCASIFLSGDVLAQSNVLIYSAAAGFVHDSIPTAVEALKSHGPSINVAFDHTADRTKITDEFLSQFAAIAFVGTTGDGEYKHPSPYNVN